MQLTDIDPFDPRLPLITYPHYRAVGRRAGAITTKRDVTILSRYAPTSAGCALPRHVVHAVGFLTGVAAFLPTSDPPAHADAQAAGTRYGAWRVGTWRPMVDQLARKFGRRVAVERPRTSSTVLRTDADTITQCAREEA